MKRIVLMLACCLFPAGVAFASNHETAAPTESVPVGEVARAVFTTEIEDREPTIVMQGIPATVDQIYLFTDLRDFEGQTVTHRWSFSGNTEAEVRFDVGGPRWRTWSLKSIPDNQRGEWTVDVLDDDGYIVESYNINAR